MSEIGGNKKRNKRKKKKKKSIGFKIFIGFLCILLAIAVVGGGSSALSEALYLSNIVNKV